MTHTCQCSDLGCPTHSGKSTCTNHGTTTLYRVDTTDETGTLMCEACASDAFSSGLFSVDFPDDYEFDEVWLGGALDGNLQALHRA